PSGRTVDIFTRDNLKNPVMANYGPFTYTDMTMTLFSYVLPAYYMEYEEGMYMGYRYYETAHDIGAAGFTYGELDGKGGVKTEGEVTYPFGYGLSYTTFEQKITNFEDLGDTISVDVQVSNTGDRAGKEVVQLYFTPPYTDYDKENYIEKPTVTLCAFAKTKELAPGASETVTLTIDKDEFTSFAAHHDNGDGTTGCYMLEEGTYTVSLRKNSHDVLDSRSFEQKETVFYDNTNPRGYEIDKQAALDDEGNVLNYPEKRMADPEAKFVAATALFPYMDEYMETQSTILTRANWDATVPVYEQRADYYVPANKPLAQNFKDLIDERNNFDAATNKQIGTNPDSVVYTDQMPAAGQQNGMTLSDMRGKDYYDPAWDSLLDQIDFAKDHDQIEEFLLSSNYYTPAIDSIGLPTIIHTEGANGIRLAFAKAEQMKTVTWCMCPVMAATWNVELAEQVGAAMAAEALANGVTARYSPAFNIHRSPFSGRNMEYYSEDPYLTGSFVSNMLNGSTNGGLIEYMKHFVLNDQETNRSTIYTWATEQTAREIYMKPFEMCIRLAKKTITYVADSEGTLATKVMRGAGGMMYSMNTFGPCTTWVNYDLATRLVRDEWNFHGLTNTDWTYPMGETDYTDMAILAGVDTWLTGNSKMTGGAGWMNFEIKDMESATVRQAYREAVHHAAYQIANSNAMQGVGPGSITYYETSPWVYYLTVADVICGLVVLGGILWMIARGRKAKRNPEEYRTR
ncbi:MAG: fibronectin type III-like domain-contianing protein, partial [Lachnospiraceae bacterium]|nr:fibronectin type III-like domain-contianing protein [Lachnospiraceae bacterium]